MTSWYNPAILARTGIRVAVSTVFGQFFDKREAMAAANAIAPQPFDDSFDYADEKDEDGAFWFDFVADTGDGWDSTFAVARMLAAQAIELGGEPSPRGALLVLGGDQVYPSASRREYGDRLLEPFETAWRLERDAGAWPDTNPDLYVIPGNHDWYDGLSAFFGLFCRRRIGSADRISEDAPGRMIAGWQTQQTRSYFAIRLPGGWWLWGTDAQLGGYIDQPQLDFFRHVAKRWMDPGSRLILCVGEPAWAYADEQVPDARFDRFFYLQSLIDEADKGHRLKLVLTGDSHHYARFTEGGRDYITCGGGGAFLHPTHQLRSRTVPVESWDPATGQSVRTHRRFELADKADGSEAVYPSRATSRTLAFANLAFAVINPWFTVVLFGLYLVFNWILDVNAHLMTDQSLVQLLRASDSAAAAGAKSGMTDAAIGYWNMLVVSPWSVLFMLAAVGAYRYFADAPRSRLQRFAIGFAHWALQTAAAIVTTWLVLGWDGWQELAPAVKDWSPAAAQLVSRWIDVIALVAATAAAAVASATLFGLYLLVMLNLFGRHSNEAFSSLRIADFRSFLRLRIGPDGSLTVHAIGLDETPRTRRRRDPSTPEPRPHLIERFTVI